MSKTRRASQSNSLQQSFEADAGKGGLSEWPSDNASTLSISQRDWPWIDAIYAADAKCDPERLINLISANKVPAPIMPFLAALLKARLGRKAGRPSILPTSTAIRNHLALEDVRKLVEEGRPVKAAVAEIAPRWGMSAKSLADLRSGRRGDARKQQP
ncbi:MULTISPECIES: hypothetical protein [Bradyrhizobium]|uniref:hypothetical protein n=1 Tax=Bradyrhizobium TaxID=374 RepID=UPI0012F4D01A|nr:hypothetical protein [Bradyrhizobium sp. CCBAU 15544]